MRAVVIDQPGTIAVRDVPDPVAAEGQVIVRVDACGVCGTDVHIVDGEFPPTPYPIIPGHEFSGELVDLGPTPPDGLSVGDRVAVDPSLFCGRCDDCRRGRGNLCLNWGAIGDTVDGAFAEFVVVPAANVYQLPSSMDSRSAALVEPLSCTVHGVRRLGPVLGESVLVVGAGTMGLLLLQLLVRAGACRLVVVDRVASRRDAAKALGATDAVNAIGDLDGEKFSAIVDVTGSVAAIEEAFASVQRGGRLLIFGVAPAGAMARVEPFRIYNDEITVIGSMAVLHSYGAALEMMASGAIETSPLLTHALPLDEFAEALSMVRGGRGIKVHILPNG